MFFSINLTKRNFGQRIKFYRRYFYKKYLLPHWYHDINSFKMYLLPLISLREGFIPSFQVPHVNLKTIGKTDSTNISELSAFLDQLSKKTKKTQRTRMKKKKKGGKKPKFFCNIAYSVQIHKNTDQTKLCFLTFVMQRGLAWLITLLSNTLLSH